MGLTTVLVYIALLPVIQLGTTGIVHDISLYFHAIGLAWTLLVGFSQGQMYNLRHVTFNLEIPPKTLWFNMGLWNDHTIHFSDACERLVEAVLEQMQLKRSTHVLDVGYGCGDSCFMLADRYGCNVTGLTNEKSQWLVSQTRLASLPCQNRVKLICGSATDDNLFDAAFDHIVSIDSAYHYDTRWKFLQTAQSQLVPGGTLGLYDLTIDPKLLQHKWLAVLMGRYVLGIPESNMVTAEAYRDRLVAMGYAQVAVNAVPADRVFGGLSRFIRRQYAQAALWDILPPWGNRVFMLSSASLFGLLARKGWVVPVIVSARKKEREEAHI